MRYVAAGLLIDLLVDLLNYERTITRFNWLNAAICLFIVVCI